MKKILNMNSIKKVLNDKNMMALGAGLGSMAIGLTAFLFGKKVGKGANKSMFKFMNGNIYSIKEFKKAVNEKQINSTAGKAFLFDGARKAAIEVKDILELNPKNFYGIGVLWQKEIADETSKKDI